jgi:hypothetical protein
VYCVSGGLGEVFTDMFIQFALSDTNGSPALEEAVVAL